MVSDEAQAARAASQAGKGEFTPAASLSKYACAARPVQSFAWMSFQIHAM